MDNGYSNMGNNMNGYNQNMPVGSAPEFTKYLILSIKNLFHSNIEHKKEPFIHK